jgi:hypothetical protein
LTARPSELSRGQIEAMDQALENCVNARSIGEWLMSTLRMFGVQEADAHRVTCMFLEALNEDHQ